MSAIFNPLFGTFTPASIGPSWYDIAEDLNKRIERAVVKGNMTEAFKLLHVMDLIDTETAMYWREKGMDLYHG